MRGLMPIPLAGADMIGIGASTDGMIGTITGMAGIDRSRRERIQS
jgi:hypothetical protein